MKKKKRKKGGERWDDKRECERARASERGREKESARASEGGNFVVALVTTHKEGERETNRVGERSKRGKKKRGGKQKGKNRGMG